MTSSKNRIKIILHEISARYEKPELYNEIIFTLQELWSIHPRSVQRILNNVQSLNTLRAQQALTVFNKYGEYNLSDLYSSIESVKKYGKHLKP